MCKTRLGHVLLSWVLLLSLTAGFSIHDHDAFGAGDYACVIDHERHPGLLDSSDGPKRLHAAGSLHEHHCLGCHFQGKRSLPKPLQSGAQPLDLSIDDLARSEDPPRAQILRSGATPRGPPIY